MASILMIIYNYLQINMIHVNIQNLHGTGYQQPFLYLIASKKYFLSCTTPCKI